MKKIRGKPIECKYCKKKFKIHPKKKKEWNENKFICPHCKIDYSVFPETERNLQHIQNKYRVKREEKYLKQIHAILISYAESFIKKHYINLIQDKSLLTYYAQSAVSLLIESDYYKKDNFYIEISFGSRLRKKCLQAIQGVKESIERVSPDESLDYMFVDGNFVEYEDTAKSELESVVAEEEKTLLLQKICDIIFGMEEYCENNRENYIRLLNICNYLSNGERALDEFFELYGRYGKFKTIQSLNIVKSEIQKILTLDQKSICVQKQIDIPPRYYVNNPLPAYDSYRIYDKEVPDWVMSRKEWSLFYNEKAKEDAEKECKRMNNSLSK